IFVLLCNAVSTRSRLRLAIRGLVVMAVPLAAFGVHEYLAGSFMDTGAVKRIQSYEAPLTSNPNDLALMLNLILPLTLALALAQSGTLPRLLLLGCAGLDAAAVILTFSRAGFICLAATSVIYFVRLLRRPERGWAIAALCLALAAVPCLPAGYLERLSTITHIESDPTGSAQERRDDTLAALRLVSRSPIVGVGIGENILALNEIRGASWKKVHNVYLEYATDLGVPGLILFLVVLVGSVRSEALRAVREALRSGPGIPRARGWMRALPLASFPRPASRLPRDRDRHRAARRRPREREPPGRRSRGGRRLRRRLRPAPARGPARRLRRRLLDGRPGAFPRRGRADRLPRALPEARRPHPDHRSQSSRTELAPAAAGGSAHAPGARGLRRAGPGEGPRGGRVPDDHGRLRRILRRLSVVLRRKREPPPARGARGDLPGARPERGGVAAAPARPRHSRDAIPGAACRLCRPPRARGRGAPMIAAPPPPSGGPVSSSDDRIRLLTFVNHFAVGGTERHVVNLGKSL